MKWILIVVAVFALEACGVRGDPVPPGTPAELGRGKPNYKRATEDIAFPIKPPPPSQKDDDEEEEQED